MRINRSILWVIGLVFILVMLAACGGSDDPVEETQPEIVVTEEGPVVSEGEPAATEGVAVELGTYGQAIDVPIMDGNRDLRISRTGENISYKIDVSVQEVYDYYRGQLDEMGWIPGPHEIETVASNLITLARANEIGDRITVTMQYNPIGLFTVINIVIVRAQ